MYERERIWDIDSNILLIGFVYALSLLASIAVIGGFV